MIATIERFRLCAWLLVILLAAPLPVPAQQAAAPAPPAPPKDSAPAFTAEQLEQIAAPVALYPDPLLAQVMMAATYPLEVVQAARFVKDNPKLQGDQLNEKLKEKDWDDSVKSLISFPQALSLMNEKLEWTQKLGDAVLGQQKELMDAIQRLRARAQKEGNLKTTAEQKVTVEPAAAPPPSQTSQTVVIQEQPTSVIKIEPANPQVVYVPSYNPTVVYGSWPYPAYPPYYPYPAGYAWGAAALSFGVGMAVGAAVWGNCNWGGGNVDVDVNRNTNFSKNVNRSSVAAERTARTQSGQGAGNRSQWQHNPENRKGVQYRDQGTQQRYNRGSNPQGAQSREAFRGRAEQGRQDLGQGGRGDGGLGGGQGGRGGGQGGVGGGQGGRGDGGLGGGQGGRGDSGLGGGQGGRGGAGQGSLGGGQGGGLGGGGRDAGAFQGAGSGSQTRSFSDRGQSSRQSSFGSGSSGASRSSGASAGSRGGGGGSRGGGGGGGGRGGGRR